MSAYFKTLDTILSEDVFLTVKSPKGDVADFTAQSQIELIVATAGVRMKIPLPFDKRKLMETLSNLKFVLSGEKKTIIGWNLKSLYSYVLGRLGDPLEILANVIDLKVIEWYLGIENEVPTSYVEAEERLITAGKHKRGGDAFKMFNRVYSPLIKTVIPEIEAIGIRNFHDGKLLHSCYEIAGQNNGRMKCNNDYVRHFNPHSTNPDTRAKLRPPLYDSVMMYLDFRHMEVSMLQWMSGDPVLGEILERGGDLYNEIWRTLTNLEPNPFYREKCKGTFLPVAYGLGSKTLAGKIEVTPEIAHKLVSRIYSKFSVAMGWLQRRQEDTVDGWATDIFGRCRHFDSDLYKTRNFHVQSPAALFCLEKLVQLHKDLKGKARIGFHVHDGYVLYVPKLNVSQVQDAAIQSLESESKIFSSLKLKVSCKVGADWGSVN